MTLTDAMTLALKLAITAETDADSERATAIAQAISTKLTEFEIARCKRQALEELELT